MCACFSMHAPAQVYIPEVLNCVCWQLLPTAGCTEASESAEDSKMVVTRARDGQHYLLPHNGGQGGATWKHHFQAATA